VRMYFGIYEVDIYSRIGISPFILVESDVNNCSGVCVCVCVIVIGMSIFIFK